MWVSHAPGMPGTFSPHRHQGKPLVSDPGMHNGRCVTHMPWCMSWSLTRGGGGHVPGIPGACAILNFTYLAGGPWLCVNMEKLKHVLCSTWNISVIRDMTSPPQNPTIFTINSQHIWNTWLCWCRPKTVVEPLSVKPEMAFCPRPEIFGLMEKSGITVDHNNKISRYMSCSWSGGGHIGLLATRPLSEYPNLFWKPYTHAYHHAN